MYEITDDVIAAEIIETRRPAKWHAGLWVRYASGHDAVYHNCAGRGVVKESFAQFAAGSECRRSKLRIAMSPIDAEFNAERALGCPYYLFSQNCEHFVRWAARLPIESPQIQRAVVGTIAGLFVWAIARRA